MLGIMPRYGKEHAEEGIEGIASLEDNWDSYGAEGTSAVAVERFRSIMEEIYEAMGRWPYHIGPHENGGIYGSWSDTIYELCIGITGDLEIDIAVEISLRFEEDDITLETALETAKMLRDWSRQPVSAPEDTAWTRFQMLSLFRLKDHLKTLSERYLP